MFSIFMFFLLFVVPSFAIRNVTVDDTSKQIIYSGKWTTSVPSPFDYGGTHQYSTDPSATAAFSFIGVGIYYMSPLWPYPVTTMISIDGAPPVLVNLQDLSLPTVPNGGPETVQSAVVWGVSGLTNTKHLLVVSMQGTTAEVEMDGLIFTALDPTDTPPSPTASPTKAAQQSSHASHSQSHTPSHSASASPAAAPSHSSTKKVTVAIIGTFIGLCVAAAFLVAGCMVYRRRRRNDKPTILESPSSPYLPDSRPDAPFTGTTEETNVVPFTAGLRYTDNSPIGSTFKGHPYVYASAGNAFGSNNSDHTQDQRQEMAMTTPALTPALSALPPAPATFSSSSHSDPNPYQDWAFRPTTVPSVTSHSTEETVSSHPFAGGLTAANPNANQNRLSALSGISGRESVAGLAYLACEDVDVADGQEAAGSSWTKTRPRTMTVMNADNAEGSSSARFDEKSGFIPSDLRTRRQEDDSVLPPPAYSYTSTG